MTAVEIRFSVAVEERADWPVDGCDSVIAKFPTLETFTPAVLRILGSHLGNEAAFQMGTHFHHGEFICTSSVDTVREWGIMPEHDGCEHCEEGVRLGVAALEANPSLTLIVGQLRWASGPADTASGG